MAQRLATPAPMMPAAPAVLQRSRSQREKSPRHYPLRLRGVRSSIDAVFQCKLGLVTPDCGAAGADFPLSAGQFARLPTVRSLRRRLTPRSRLSMANKLPRDQSCVKTTRTCTRTIPRAPHGRPTERWATPRRRRRGALVVLGAHVGNCLPPEGGGPREHGQNRPRRRRKARDRRSAGCDGP